MNSGIRILFLTLLVCFFGFGSAQKPVTITVWGMAITPDEKGNDLLVRQFERDNPNIKVKLLGMGAGAMNPQKLMTAIVGGSPPDVIMQDRFTISDWASRGAFRSLDDLIERDRATDPYCPTPDQYYPAAWNEAIYDGKLYGIPFAADDRVLYWNTQVFAEKADDLRKAGLDPTRPPQTWSEILAYSKVLTEFNPDGTLKRAGFIPNEGNSWLYMFAFQNNADFMSEDGTKCTLNTPAAVEALQFMKDGYDILGGYENTLKFKSGMQGKENDPFAIGQIAMIINGDWRIAEYARYSPKAKFKTAPAPVPDDRFYKRGRFVDEKDTFVTWSGGFAYAIPRGSKNVDASWEFIKWIQSLDGRMLYARGQADLEQSRGRKFIPRIQAHIKATEQQVARYASGDSVYDQALRTHAEMMPYAKLRPATFVGQKLWDEHVRAIEQACRGAQTPEAALQSGQTRVQLILDEFYSKSDYPQVNIATWVLGAFGIVVLGLVVWVALMIKKGKGRVSVQETRAGYAFISPWIIGFLVFTLGPMVASLVFSFMNYDVLNPAHFVGAKNFTDVFVVDRDLLMKALENVGYLAVVGIPLGLSTGLAIALLLNTGAKGIRFYRTVYYMPSITPTVASTFLWIWIMTPDNKRGLLNNLWNNTITNWFGVASPGWLTVEPWAKPALILMGLWAAGGAMILWLAGLKGISRTLYEAAEIDGASGWKQFVSVTLPQLSPLIFFNSVMAFIGVLQTFDNVYIITKGENMGPNDTLATPVYMLFNNGFAYFRMGYASAIAWLIFFIVMAVTLVQFKVAPRWVHTEVDR
ncbi:MAG: extracellular solute-binding protein [Fimbriimonadaceae bacterium]|nr:extracellular solute-binding protein [Fimbriimonadaceae bacterium]